MNKRGSVPIIALVVLTLVLSISTLITFKTTSNKFDWSFSSVSYMEDVYVKENIAKYQLYIVGKNLSNYGVLTEEGFRENFLKFDFKDDYMINLKSYVAQKKFKISNGQFELVDPDNQFVIYAIESGVTVKYYTKLKTDLR